MKKDFYEKVADIIGMRHEYNDYNDKIFRRDRETGLPCMTNSSRFVGRAPGNGRFPGVGLVRRFGETIHITLTNPQAHGTFTCEEEALDFLRKVFPTHS